MLRAHDEFSHDCHERAARARANADATPDPKQKAEFLSMEARWLSLAKSGSMVERLNRFLGLKGISAPNISPTTLGNFWPVEFESGQTVLKPGQKVSTVFFLNDAALSLVTPGGMEVAMLGPDAGVGMSTALHGGDYPYAAVARVSGTGLACDTESFKEAVRTSPAVFQNVLMAEQRITGLIAQTAVCNVSHQMPARLPRWFLRLHQLSGRLEIDVTQNDLAALLGVQRTTVSKAQDQLKREGLLAYARGRIQILDVAGLKLRACPCAVTEHV